MDSDHQLPTANPALDDAKIWRDSSWKDASPQSDFTGVLSSPRRVDHVERLYSADYDRDLQRNLAGQQALQIRAQLNNTNLEGQNR